VHVIAGRRARHEFVSPRYEVSVAPRKPFPTSKGRRAWEMLRTTIPESSAHWVPGATEAGLRALATMPSDTVIYGRAAPGVSNIVAWHLARSTGRPFVAHFSDEWPDAQVLANGRKWAAPYKWPLFHVWRRRIVRDAGAVTLTNPFQADDILGSLRQECQAKTFVVTHLPSDTPRPPARPQYDAFHIVHTGNFYPGQTSAAVMQGLRLFLDRTPGARAHLRFTQAGWSDGDVPDWSARCSLEDVVRCTGRLAQDEVLDLIDRASLLLAIDYARPGSRTILSKLPDYINARRPILAITSPSSALGRFFAEDQAGLTALYDSPEEVAYRLRRVYAAWTERRDDAFLPGEAAVDTFRSGRVLRELSGALAVAGRRRNAPGEQRAFVAMQQTNP
jgi:hypothetical protein